LQSSPITAGVGGKGSAESANSPLQVRRSPECGEPDFQGDMAQDTPMDVNESHAANGKGKEAEFDTNLYSRML